MRWLTVLHLFLIFFVVVIALGLWLVVCGAQGHFLLSPRDLLVLSNSPATPSTVCLRPHLKHTYDTLWHHPGAHLKPPPQSPVAGFISNRDGHNFVFFYGAVVCSRILLLAPVRNPPFAETQTFDYTGDKWHFLIMAKPSRTLCVC